MGMNTYKMDNDKKEELIRQLYERIPEEFQWQIPIMFEECYVLDEGMYHSLVLKPYDNKGRTIKYVAETLEKIGPELWEYAKENGELVEWQ